MPVIFSQSAGHVLALPESAAAGAIQLGSVTGTGGPISYPVYNTIITKLGLSAAGNFQFLHTLGNDVYVYTFGDRMGQVQLHGLSFASQCPQRQQAHGFERLYLWYNANRLAARRAPVRVTVGRSTTFDGFVTGLNATASDASNRTIQFQMSISLLPSLYR